MSNADKTQLPEKDMATELANISNGQVLETGAASSHSKLKSRHLYMIAMGGCIGTAYLVGSGKTLSRGGPALALVGFIIICSVVWVFSTLLFEMAAYIPLNGAGPDYYTTHFLSKSFGFAMGWNYWYAYSILVPFEITVATLVIQYWNPPVPDAVFISILFVVIVALNYLPVGNAGEAEFAFSSLKLTMLIGMIILSIILAAGGGPSGDRVGFRYWNNPGPANAWIVEGSTGRFVSFLGVLISVVLPLSFAAEMVAVCSGETSNPQRTVPKAAKAFIVRLIVFYVLPILGVTLTCPSNAPELTSGGEGAGSSPFVVGIKHAGIHVLDHIVNAVILCSAWSAGNVYMHLASRSIYSLATAGNAPKIFIRTNQWGVHYLAVTSCAVLTLLAYLNVSSSSGAVFTWLVNMINMAAFFSWILLSFSYIRFRAALEIQGVDRSTLPFVSVCGKPGAYFCIVFFMIVGCLNGFYVFFPSQWNVSDFLTAYIGTLLFVLLYIGHKLTVGRKEPWLIPSQEICLAPKPEGASETSAQGYIECAGAFSQAWKNLLGKC
ncbi:proline permease PrnB [Penicillium lagena]|uniref:proline permease PrnB n=1 Tax=Penicillium lagena TaxID=94218 RepID=UPI00254034E8|nr:proline permease PrnB [Penicillium lagena]KAJ5601232.1 proline permease PrnB [Penicillium lagena]